MEGLINVLSAMFILFAMLLLTLLLGHVISYVFGYGWALSWDDKGACAVTGCILGAIAIVAYFMTKYEDD